MRALPEVQLAPGSLVIGDLHLDVEAEGALEPFLAWLADARSAPRIVILGDLFEYWIGRAQERTPGGRRLMSALAEVVEAGTAIDVIPGNRDFLLDARFEEGTGCCLRADGLVGRLPSGGRVLFVHGDELATHDRAYQRLRRVLRSRPVAWLARALPYPATRALARRLRHASRSAVAAKSETVTRLEPDACRALARRSRADVVVCGHAHRFRDERLEGGPRWLVVDAFGGPRDTLRSGASDVAPAPREP